MSSSSEKPEQIQASVAAALSRLRGDLGPTGATAPRLEDQHGGDLARPANDVRGDPFFRSIQSPPPGAHMAGSGSAPIPMTPFPRMQAAQDPGATEPEASSNEAVPEPGSAIEIPDMPERAAHVPVAMPEPHEATQEQSAPLASAALAATAAAASQTPAGSNSPFARMIGGAAPAGGSPAQRDLLADLPPPPISEPLSADGDAAAAAQRRRRNRRVAALGAVIIVAALGAWLWTGGEPSTEVPVITADATPEKVKPAEEGGLQVQNQDVQVLDPSAQTQTETVMPEPEQPITPPTQPAPSQSAGAEQPTVVDSADNNAGTAAPAADAVPEPGVPLVETPLPALEENGAPPAAASTDTATNDTVQPTTAEAAPAAPAVAAPEPTQAPPAEAAPAQAAEAPAATEPASAPAEATSAPATTLEPQATQAETPATQAAPTQEAAVTPSAPAGTARVQLAAGKSEAAVQQEWAALQKAHPQLLGDLKLMIERVDKGEAGIFYRLQAGPLADRKAAGQLCSSLKAQGQDCLAVAK